MDTLVAVLKDGDESESIWEESASKTETVKHRFDQKLNVVKKIVKQVFH